MVSVAMGASSSSGLAVKGVNSAIRRVASDQNKVRHIMQSKHAWTKVTKKNQWKYVKPIVKKAMKSGKMEAIGKTKGKEIVYKACVLQSTSGIKCDPDPKCCKKIISS